LKIPATKTFRRKIQEPMTPPRFELQRISPNEAISYLTKGANLGNTDAALMLAEILIRGVGVNRDPEAAGRWLLVAIRSDHKKAAEWIAERLAFCASDGLEDAVVALCKLCA
jgi:TPR repeat protein